MPAGDSADERQTGPTQGSLHDAASVLVLSDGMDPDARASYYDTLLPADPSDLRVLAIEYARGPDGWLGEWRTHVGKLPAETAIISIDDGVRSAAAPAVDPTTYERTGNGISVGTVESPDDLTGLGIAVGGQLKRWADTPESVLLTLNSMTVLLQYVELKRVFRFLHVLVNRVKAAGAVGHYHMDPAAHDEQVVETLASVFDAVVRYEDGEWQITRGR